MLSVRRPNAESSSLSSLKKNCAAASDLSVSQLSFPMTWISSRSD
jgi:hypothetical protein